MNVLIIGSTQYRDNKIKELKIVLEKSGNEVKLPAFDDYPNYTVLDILEHNKKLVQWADVVYYVWDGRSIGTIFDFGMVFALGKPLIKGYLCSKKLEDGIDQYCINSRRI